MDDPAKTFEMNEEGYPTEEWLAALRERKFDYVDAHHFLLGTFQVAADVLPCCQYSVSDIEDHGYPAKLVSFSTGGWSGAEDIIDTMLGHFWIKHFQTKWERGGHYEFKLPPLK